MSDSQTPQAFTEGQRVRVLYQSQRAYPRRTWGKEGMVTGMAYYARTGVRRYHVRYTLPNGQPFDEDIREEHLEAAGAAPTAPMIPTAPTSITEAARHVARELIRHYVLRGDEIEWLRRGGMSHSGAIGDAHIRLDHIIVERIGPWDGGTPCNVRFRLKDIYCEIQQEARGVPQQAGLWKSTEVPA